MTASCRLNVTCPPSGTEKWPSTMDSPFWLSPPPSTSWVWNTLKSAVYAPVSSNELSAGTHRTVAGSPTVPMFSRRPKALMAAASPTFSLVRLPPTMTNPGSAAVPRSASTVCPATRTVRSP
jgi:hypothetical protein